MTQWHAKVHKSGNKVAIFNGPKLVKVVESSKDSFEPAEAQKFAEQLIKELETRSATNMTQGNEPPSITTKFEQQTNDLAAINQQATGAAPGKGPGGSNTLPGAAAPAAPAPDAEEMSDDADPDIAAEPATDADPKEAEIFASKENNYRSIIANLKTKLAQEKNERLTERKARRGLAIAKQMVVEGKIDDSYDTIKEKVAQIIKLEDCEIDRLERKVAGEQEFESVEDANKEIRRQARIARINRQAAAEAQEDMDEKQADQLDRYADIAEAKVAHIQQVVEEMKTAAEKPAEECADDKDKKDDKPAEGAAPAAPAAPVAPPQEAADAIVEAQKPATGIGAGGQPAAPAATPAAAPVVKEEDDEDKTASLYRIIATNHRKLAEKAEAAGNVAEADKQDELADAAEEQAEKLEKPAPASAGPGTQGQASPTKAAEKKDDKKDEKKPEGEVAPAAAPAEGAAPAAAPEGEVAEESGEKEEKKSHREPGQIQTDTSKHTPLKREGEVVEDSFGIDKNASLIEQNDYADDPEVAMLSSIWRGAPKDNQ